MAGYKPFVSFIVFLGFCAWVVALAGISEITNDCYKQYQGDGYYITRTLGVVNLGQNCVRGLQFQWWGVWFEFIVLSLTGALICTSLFAAHQATLTGLFATVTAINMVNSRTFLNGSPANYIWQVSVRNSGLNVAAAGYIMFCTFNLILVLLVGSGLVWFKEADYIVGYGDKAAAQAAARGPGPNFAQPATFASPLSGGGARAYLPNSGATGEVTISATQ